MREQWMTANVSILDWLWSIELTDNRQDWQSETANFYSRPGDSHLCANTTSEGRALPFCTASCNSMVPFLSLMNQQSLY